MSSARASLVWLQGSACGGCTMALMGAESPDVLSALDWAGIDLLWHPSFGEHSEQAWLALMRELAQGKRPLDLLCVEGSIDPAATDPHTMAYWVAPLALRARYVVAVGSCASFGGVAVLGRPDTVALQQRAQPAAAALLEPDWVSAEALPVVNVAGCPPHPGWITETLARLAQGTLGAADLDELARPRALTDHLVHHGCARNEFYEFKASAEQLDELGCLMEHLGCLGTQARADCNLRGWNGSGSCLKGGFPCINCTAPGFERPAHAFGRTQKIAGIPTSLPSDMPKAWFVALASLSKAATPERLRRNARAERIVVGPRSTKR